jgi:methyl-accepting chemotaxis protein
MDSKIKLWQRLVIVALTGVVPMLAITLFVISSSINKDINFGEQETRGNTYQRSLEKLLELFPQHEALARKALAGDAAANNQLAQVKEQIDHALGELDNVQHALGAALKVNDAELTARKRENARLALIQSDWQALKSAPLTVAAAEPSTAKLVTAIRTLVTHVGDLSNLILDTDLDSYYLIDATLGALPQTQQRLSDITLKVGESLRNHQAGSNITDVAIQAAMLQQDDQDRITGDVQTCLSEDKNFHGVSASLQKNLPGACDKYVAANQAFLGLLNRVISGANLPDADTFEAAGWAAREESFRFWETGSTELDQLLTIRVNYFRNHRLFSYVSIVAVLALVAWVIWLISHRLTITLSTLTASLKNASGQVTSAAAQFRGSSQKVAEVASEQAASMEESSASLEEISSITKHNAENATNSKQLSEQASASATTGLERLGELGRTLNSIKSAVGEMEAAVHEMQDSSQEIAKIIKTIDEIAFQTNLLALNAAVEAARAGEAGLGFAVVADEVRALAQRSAQAARDTSDKIEHAIKRSELGGVASAKVVQNLAQVEGNARNIEHVFNGIVAQIKSLDHIIGEISAASREQSFSVSQVNLAVSQMDEATQSNAAIAEENAGAAEQLSAQVGTLQQIAHGLEIVVHGHANADATTTTTSQTPTGSGGQSTIHMSSNAARFSATAKNKRGNDSGIPLPEPSRMAVVPHS